MIMSLGHSVTIVPFVDSACDYPRLGVARTICVLIIIKLLKLLSWTQLQVTPDDSNHCKKNCALNLVEGNLNYKFSHFPTEPSPQIQSVWSTENGRSPGR